MRLGQGMGPEIGLGIWWAWAGFENGARLEVGLGMGLGLMMGMDMGLEMGLGMGLGIGLKIMPQCVWHSRGLGMRQDSGRDWTKVWCCRWAYIHFSIVFPNIHNFMPGSMPIPISKPALALFFNSTPTLSIISQNFAIWKWFILVNIYQKNKKKKKLKWYHCVVLTDVTHKVKKKLIDATSVNWFCVIMI